MKFLSAVATVLLLASLEAPATILIYSGPAPIGGYGVADSARRNKAYVVLDTETSQVQLVNFGGRRKGKNFTVIDPMPLDSATIPGVRRSDTVATGVLRNAPQPPDFDTFAISMRGRNAVVNPDNQLAHPRVFGGIFRRTTKASTEVSHIEQRFTVRYDAGLSNASNAKNETLAEAVERVGIALENRGYDANDLP